MNKQANIDDEVEILDGAPPEIDLPDDEDEPHRPSGDTATMPTGYKILPDGVWRRSKGKGDKPTWDWLCSRLDVVAQTRDGHNEAWGKLVQVVDPDGVSHRVAIPGRMLAGDGRDVRALLMDYGLRIATGPRAAAAFADLLSRWNPQARATATDKHGWVAGRKSFVLGRGRILGEQGVVFQNEHLPGAADAFVARGTLEGWRANVAALCVGNIHMVFAVSVALAGPLLDLVDIPGGGFHERGESSKGKTTLLSSAASVWGTPAGIVMSWRATANGLEATCQVCNSTLLALDELSEISSVEAGATVYMVANGASKSRASRSGGARRRATWRTIVLSSGEVSLADKVAERGGRTKAGQEVRLLDIAATGRKYGAFDHLHGSEDGAAFANRVNRAAAEHHGVAGPAFVEEILKMPSIVAGRALEAMREFKDRACVDLKLDGADGQVFRAADRFALVYAAGVLASRFGITGWSESDVEAAVMEVFRLWIDGRGGVQDAERAQAIDRTRAFISAHGASRFEVIGAVPATIVRDRAGWRNATHFFIAQDAWREIHAGSDPTRAAKYLADAKLLVPGEGRNLAQRMPRDVPGRPRAYCVPDGILGDAEHD